MFLVCCEPSKNGSRSRAAAEAEVFALVLFRRVRFSFWFFIETLVLLRKLTTLYLDYTASERQLLSQPPASTYFLQSHCHHSFNTFSLITHSSSTGVGSGFYSTHFPRLQQLSKRCGLTVCSGYSIPVFHSICLCSTSTTTLGAPVSSPCS
ncbi:hypothetical protein HPP92_026823 [Vanilla planifolia]|uniref:Uncharacterized protein n=1 Tax=Vanilla planifolia TaxID=51239 RepID=A0A835PBU0_VANPL|nr:hypothetical protein HPP92_027011 [Vanilla planifolia]KAG0450297.1 hypothetical protein HPP92_026823 [Vanilla planifolia]